MDRSAILVLEQNSHVRELVSDFLSESQLSVTCVLDGYEALDLARQKCPALIITEVLTPRLDGLSLCRLIKEDNKMNGTKVLILSVFDVKERAFQAGADGFLLKPIEKTSLMATVRSLLKVTERQQS
jgi:CheY-like chemotaxis protein